MFFLIWILTVSVYGQKKAMPSITTPMSSNWIKCLNPSGKIIYFSKLNNTSLEGKYIINETKLNNNTDIVNSYYSTGYKFEGFFTQGYKTGIWKTTYKKILVKTAHWNNGLVTGLYTVKTTKGVLLYNTNFDPKGNGKFKDYYYKTGVLKQEGDYQNGKKEGEWCNYNTKGELTTTVHYKQGVVVK